MMEYRDAYYRAVDQNEKLRQRIERLESLLKELIDIEGPQPGHVMWYEKVCAALAWAREAPDA